MGQETYITSDFATTSCETCANLRRIYATAAVEYVALLTEHANATHRDSCLLKELVSALRREIARGAIKTHMATEHHADTASGDGGSTC
jgi:hypothetical protein